MGLIDRLRKARNHDVRQREPLPEPAANGLVGPSVLREDQLRVIERVLEIEAPMYSVNRAAARAEQQSLESTVVPEPEPEPLPLWAPSPRQDEPGPEPLPLWVPNFVDLGHEPEPMPRTSSLGPCPNCGEESRVTRIDLTGNAGWLTCQACGLRWGGTIERPELEQPGLGGERGEAIAG
jgi:hypothetical protein